MQNLIGNVVEFQKEILNCESYAEPEMRARVLHIEANNAGYPDLNDHIYTITFDFGEFDEFNKQFENYNYYDHNGVAQLNARQAGYYKPQDRIYFSSPELYPFEMYFKIVDQKTNTLHEKFKQSGETNYVNWLENQVEV